MRPWHLVLVLLGALSACTTGVLIADPDIGFESDGDRYVRLRLETVQLDVVDVPAGEFTIPGALCLKPVRGQAPCRALRFRLPFMAWNGHDEPWPVKLGMFTLERSRGGETAPGEKLVAPDATETVALLPPRSGAHFDVLVHVAGIAPDEDPFHGEYKLTVQSEVGGGETLLVERLSVGSFDQISQIARFLGTATLLLIGLAAL